MVIVNYPTYCYDYFCSSSHTISAHASDDNPSSIDGAYILHREKVNLCRRIELLLLVYLCRINCMYESFQ